MAFPAFYHKDKTGGTNIQSWGCWVTGRTRTTFPSLWFLDHMIKHAAKLVFQCDFLKQKLQYFFRSSTSPSALSKWEQGDTCKESLLDCFPFTAFQHTKYLNQIQSATLNSNVATLWTQIHEESVMLQQSCTNVSYKRTVILGKDMLIHP